MRMITVNDASRLSITAEGYLMINSVVTSDDGVYQCVATNAAGSDMGTVNLTVHGKNNCSILSIIHNNCCIFASYNNLNSS